MPHGTTQTASCKPRSLQLDVSYVRCHSNSSTCRWGGMLGRDFARAWEANACRTHDHIHPGLCSNDEVTCNRLTVNAQCTKSRTLTYSRTLYVSPGHIIAEPVQFDCRLASTHVSALIPFVTRWTLPVPVHWLEDAPNIPVSSCVIQRYVEALHEYWGNRLRWSK